MKALTENRKVLDFVKESAELACPDEIVWIDGSEAQLAKQFGVSKAPVRDALHLLCSQGYLISYPRKGYMINMYSAQEINQVQVIRRQLEKLCVELAIENATDEEILSLEADLIDAFIEKHKGSKNAILQDLLYKASMAAIKSSSNLEKHEHIVDALLERNLEKAQQYLEEDIMLL